MNTLPAIAFIDSPDHNLMSWPLTPNRDLAPTCALGSTIGEVFVYNAIDRVFASQAANGATQFWLVTHITSKAATVRLVTPRVGESFGEPDFGEPDFGDPDCGPIYTDANTIDPADAKPVD